MTDRILKYKLTDRFCTIGMQKGAEVLTARMEVDGSVFVWAAVDAEEAEFTERHFAVFATGEHIPENTGYTWIETCFRDGYVWHVCEIWEKTE